MLTELAALAPQTVAYLALVLFVLFFAARCGWGVGAWLAGKLK